MQLFKKLSFYFLAPLLSLLIFILFFQLWKIDLALPIFSYDNDALISIFIAKNIINSGSFVCSDKIGLPNLTQEFCLYDFPIQSDFFHLSLIKFLAQFSNNPFLVVNLFFILTFAMIALTGFIALRQSQIGIFSAVLISILYTFAPYHFSRNIWHLFISNYMIVPLTIMVGLWIADNKIKVFAINEKQQYSLVKNKFFIISSLIAAFAAFNNIYYAFYSAVIFIFSWFLNFLKNGRFTNSGFFEVVILCLIIFAALFCLYLPTLFYQLNYGFNPYLAGRATSASELYGLRIIDLLLPVANHYIDYFSTLKLNFNSLVEAGAERTSESLGLIASISFLFLLIWLPAKSFSQQNSLAKKTIIKFSLSKKDQNLISNLAGINMLGLLMVTVGGFIMFMAISLPMLRSHARFAIFISFLAFFFVAIIFDKLADKKLFGKTIFTKIIIAIVFTLALFDQAGKASADSIQSQEMKDKFFSDKNFIEKIENFLPQKSMIFILPAFGFPENGGDDYRSIIAYAHSKNLRWSYPVVAGRRSFFWQQKVINLDFKQFIAELKNAGFAGIYLDKEQYRDIYTTKNLIALETNLKSVAKSKIISSDKKIIFYQI
ncbi:MAG: hypothetical protein SFV53_02550 [Rickettsiales bacterium]|nr:hypothetical protein [Rickettsiales bacterium]